MPERHDTIVIGGGQAGLAMSYHLSRIGREHVVLERRRVAERWRSERWDSLAFQVPNWLLHLPGRKFEGDPDVFVHHHEVIRFIEEYAAHIRAPLRCGVEVRALARRPDSERFSLETSVGTLEASDVVIATGPYQRPLTPSCAALLPGQVAQIHANAYRNPDQLPRGAVLVVGAGASGCQIAEELYHAGRQVVFSISRHRRVPRCYRGRDLMWWLVELGLVNQTREQLSNGEIPPPVAFTGVGGGHDIDLRRFAADGVRLAGHLKGVGGGKLLFEDNVEPILCQADAAAEAFCSEVDDHLRRAGVSGPRPGADEPSTHSPPRPVGATRELEMSSIGSVVWCSGYALDFAWVHLPVLDDAERPVQRRGVTSVPGAYFLGLQWMHAWKSSFLFGVGDDAEFIADHMAGRR